MVQRFNFIKRAIDALPTPPPGKRATYYDTKVTGLALRVTDKGTKTFLVRRRINGKPTRVNLGKYPDVTVEKARTDAQGALGEIATGGDPVARKRADKARAVDLETVFTDYLQARKALKPGTINDYNRVMNEAFEEWKTVPILEITKEMIERKHAKLGARSPARANNAMRVLRALFNFAAGKYEDEHGRPVVAENPVGRLSHTRGWYRVERRQTVIKAHQIKPWFEAVTGLQPDRSSSQADVTRDYMLFLLLTGLRRQEAAQLKWCAVDFASKSFTVLDTKNRQPHELPLSDYLLAMLERRKAAAGKATYVFPDSTGKRYMVEPRHWMAKVIQQSGVPFALHDLRRTFATVAESLDIPAYALKRLLNHRMNLGDVTAGYIVIDVERLRKPMQKITDFILKSAGVKPTAEVVELQTGER